MLHGPLEKSVLHHMQMDLPEVFAKLRVDAFQCFTACSGALGHGIESRTPADARHDVNEPRLRASG
jgi:hypothetical protein